MVRLKFPHTHRTSRRVFEVCNLFPVALGLVVLLQSRSTIAKHVTKLAFSGLASRLSSLLLIRLRYVDPVH